MRFRLVVYNATSTNTLYSQDTHEFLGDATAIWFLWCALTNDVQTKHVEVFNLAGQRMKPELGISGMVDRIPEYRVN